MQDMPLCGMGRVSEPVPVDGWYSVDVEVQLEGVRVWGCRNGPRRLR